MSKKMSKKKKKTGNAPVIMMQGGPSKDAVRETGKVILKILKSDQEQATAQLALTRLGDIVSSPTHCAVTGSRFEMGPKTYE